MKLEPTEKDERISPFYIVAYAAFLLIPCFAFYIGLQHHSTVALIGASVAIIGFSFLLITSIRHNRKIAQKEKG